MGFLNSLKSLLSGHQSGDDADHWLYVRCRRCGEVIKTRLDLQHSLNPRDEGGFMIRKTMVGNQRCFQRVEVELIFDENLQLVEREIAHGDFITAEEFDENAIHQ